MFVLTGYRRAMSHSKDPAVCAAQVKSARETSSAAVVKTVTSTELLAGQTEIQIVHESRVYRLRKTTSGKLILTR